jgi:prepilin-type N-terminal cleavage/methylation domain-containing protein
MIRRRGFTLIELLVVIAIIAVLIGLLLPSVQKVREAAARASCQNNLHQLGIAAQNYENTTGYLPPGAGNSPPSGGSPASLLAWILPYMEQGNLYNAFDFSMDVNNSASNYTARITEVKPFICPMERSTSFINQPGFAPPGQPAAVPAGRANYVGNIGTTADPRGRVNGDPASADLSDGGHLGVFNYTTANGRRVSARITDITDGTTNTAMWSETTLSTNTATTAATGADAYNPTMI